MVAATCSPCLIKQIIANSSGGRQQKTEFESERERVFGKQGNKMLQNFSVH